MDRFDGKKVIVTGGGSGIGEAIAKRFATLGAEVFIIGRSAAKLESVVRQIAAGGGRAAYAVADLQVAEQASAAVTAAAQRWGTIDVLVNDAGIYREGPFVEITTALIDELVDINLKGPIFTTLAAVPRMQEGAMIINIASTSGLRALHPQQTVYAATKAALVHFGACLAQELAPRGIRVNTVSPGPIRTPIIRTVIPEEKIAEVEKMLAGLIPLGRLGEPDEVASAVAFLAATPFATGSNLVLDGGTVL